MLNQPAIGSVLATPLIDLGDQHREYGGVLAPFGWSGGTGVTAQFLEDADHYHERYFNVAYVAYMLNVALDALKSREDPALILDIGSGSGPSVAALLERFPQAHVVATDTSPQLLAILRRELARRGLLGRCTTLCVDLNVAAFASSSFDMAIGSAILHHLFDPGQFLERIFPIIRAGGSMAFFEPFEPGYKVLGLIYGLILEKSKYDISIPHPVAEFFRKKIKEYAIATKCEPKDPVVYADIDDKWAFTSAYLNDIGQRMGAKKTIISALNHTGHPFADQIRTELRLGLNMDASTLPAWVHEVVAEIEDGMSDHCKRDFALARTIAFTK